jgi:sugar lactone lactonase YvrE
MIKISKPLIAVVCCFVLSAAPALAFMPSGGVPSASGPLSEVATFAGAGGFDDAEEQAAAAEANFRFPFHVAALADGSVLVSDSSNHVIRRIRDGEVTVYAGFLYLDKNDAGLPVGALLDGTRETAVFNQPAGLAVDSRGNVFVADSGNHAIRKIDPQGVVTTVAGTGVMGYADGRADEARFNHPQDVAVAPDGTLYVADTGNHAIRKIAPDGTVSTLNALSERVVEVVPGYVVEAGDYQDGPLSEAKFNEPFALEWDRSGNLYVSDSGNHLIRYVDLAAGRVSTVAGTVRRDMYAEGALYAAGAYADGAARQAGFHFPKGLAATDDGGLVIADSLNHTVRFLHDGTVTTLAGSMRAEHGFADGVNGGNLLHNPTDVAIAGDQLLIADAYNQRIRLYSLYALPEGAERDGIVDVALGNELIFFRSPVQLVRSRVMVPVGDIASALGAQVSETEGRVTVAPEQGIRLVFAADDGVLRVVADDGSVSDVRMDAIPFFRNGTFYVPVRYLAEALGFAVDWDGVTQTVILRK